MNEELQGDTAIVHSDEPKKLRTFEDDIAQAVKSGAGSALKIALAEQEKLEHVQAEVGTQKKSVLFVVLGLAFLLGAAATIGYVIYAKYSGVQLDLSNQPRMVEHPFMQGDRITTVDFDKVLPKNGIKQPLAYTVGSDELSSNTVKIILVEHPSDGKNPATYAKTSELFERLAPHAPNQLTRTLDSTFALGMYQGDKLEPFLLLKTDSFENAFAGMLGWEKFMSDDIYAFMGVEIPKVEKNLNEFGVETDGVGDLQINTTANTDQATTTDSATSTTAQTEATTTQTTSSTTAQKPPRDIHLFIDRTIRNRDVRVIQDNDGKIYFVYGFPKSGAILITTSIESYFEVLGRLK